MTGKVKPLYRKPYVYVLFKPNGLPFYVGKGNGSRINDHFKPSNLKVNSPKTGIIKKYKDVIRREIVAYFDTDESALDFEEYLISYYGLLSEGGLLTNYAKNRFEYSEKFSEDVCSLGAKNRECKYDESVVLLALHLKYDLSLQNTQIANICGIGCEYLTYILSGKKRKDVFERFKNGERPAQSQQYLPDIDSTDVALSIAYHLYVSGLYSCSHLSEILDTSHQYLLSIFCGRKRTHLGFNAKEHRVGIAKKHSPAIREDIFTLRGNGKSLTEIVKITGVPKTTVSRIIRQTHKQEILDKGEI